MEDPPDAKDTSPPTNQADESKAVSIDKEEDIQEVSSANAIDKKGKFQKLTDNMRFIEDFSVPRSEPITIGRLAKNSNSVTHRQYLLPMQSAAVREFFREKGSYTEVANTVGAEMEFTKLIALVKDTEWPKYQVIELRAQSADSLDNFDRKLLDMNPCFGERIAFDPNKHIRIDGSCKASTYSASDVRSDTSYFVKKYKYNDGVVVILDDDEERGSQTERESISSTKAEKDSMERRRNMSSTYSDEDVSEDDLSH